MISALAGAAAMPIVLYGFSSGPLVRLTGAPGDSPGACTDCHSGTLNSFGGKVEILLPNGTTYSPGVTQRVQVKITDAEQKRWGFELSARLNSDLANGQAGDLNTVDGNTQVKCDGAGGPKPCANNGVQFIEHTSAGTRNGTPSPVTFEFDWTPPPTDQGPVTLYVAANAANGNGAPTGDHIYTTNLMVTPAATSTKPVINTTGVTNGPTYSPDGITPAAWVTIFGSNLGTTTRGWQTSDFVNGKLPTSLDGLSVMIDGKPAYVAFTSPTQVNVLAPDDANRGSVQVQVTNPQGTSDPVSTTLQDLAPGFFTFDTKYLAATHLDSTLVGKPNLLPSVTTTPAAPGEFVVLYGSGFGPTDPVMPADQLVTAVANLDLTKLQVTVGGLPAEVQFGGLIPNYAGLYQFNVKVPAGLTSGDQAVVATINGVSSPKTDTCCFLTVAAP
jgi:uncharacterized protein (TIGR03437 family)